MSVLVYSVLSCVIIVLGMFGNTLFLAVVIRTRSMHTTTNFLLANIAVADLLTLVTYVPGVVMTFVPHPRGIMGRLVCMFFTNNHIGGVTLIVSGFTLTVLSVERYNALIRPLRHRLRLDNRTVWYAILIIWISSIAFVIPLFLYARYDNNLSTCNYSRDLRIYWYTLAGIICISFTVLGYCYFKIIKGIYFSNIISSELISSSRADELIKRKIVKMLLTVSIGFVLFYMPYSVAECLTVASSSEFYKIATILAYCSSCTNPLIYSFRSSNYRQAFLQVIGELRCFVRRKI